MALKPIQQHCFDHIVILTLHLQELDVLVHRIIKFIFHFSFFFFFLFLFKSLMCFPGQRVGLACCGKCRTWRTSCIQRLHPLVAFLPFTRCISSCLYCQFCDANIMLFFFFPFKCKAFKVLGCRFTFEGNHGRKMD